jgi:cytochrome P450
VSYHCHCRTLFDSDSYLLVRHPHVLRKLRTEIDCTFKRSPILDRGKLRDLHYLQKIIKESMSLLYNCDSCLLTHHIALRLYPSVPINNRTARKDTVLPVGGGPDGTAPIYVPKGANVAFCPYILHRRPDLYGMDAMLFRPERWDEDLPLRKGPDSIKWSYIPFGAGPRTCLGSKYALPVAVHLVNAAMLVDFALTETAYTIVRLLLEFPTLNLPEGEAVEPIGAEKQVMTLVMSIGTACKVSTV